MNRRFHHSGMKPTIQRIAREYFGVETLETRNSDRLDFYDVAVWSIDKALTEAYKAGLEDQGATLHSDQPIIFGNKPESVIRSLGEQGFTDEGISHVMRSCGIEMKVTDVSQILQNDKVVPAVLSTEQADAIQYRATLYKGYLK